ncbi:iron ABC transporter permease [Helicobacter apodemus]|uniref:Iron ABC transporter permease n=1 Tax=Helicobacter apodemus TaxID=135569 RepID=A0A4U8UEC4_9HELI|nr:iron ABC transporter permease [Helicobacter apodemus]TLE14968.1 iron ABC transporter permease [Helicobacter apodemus]
MKYLLLLCVLALLSFFVLGVGRYPLEYRQILEVLLSPWATTLDERLRYIILEVRLPRIVLAIFVGASLGICGASFQSIFRNPLASPDILGVASGAGFGAALAILLGLNIYFLTLFAFAFGILTLILVLLIVRDSNNRIMIILGGIIISALFQSFISLLKYIADPQDALPAMTYWLLGSLNVSDFHQLIFCCLGMLFGGIIIFVYRWKHNLLMLDDNEAKSLGLNIRSLRIGLIFASTLMVSCVVSICGIIGWVGLIIPHIARMIGGSNMSSVMSLSLVLGAIFMLVIDTLSRSLSSEEIPISILSAVIGALFFIVILYRFKGVMKL